MKVLIDIQPQADGSYAIADQLADIADELNRGRTTGKTFDVLDPSFAMLARYETAIQQAMDIEQAGGSSDALEDAREDYDMFLETFLQLITGAK